MTPMVLAAIVVWGMARRNGPGGARLMARAAVCGVAVLGAVSWTTAVDPFASDTDLHARATLVAYMALIVSGVLSGCVLSGLGAMARVVRGIMSRRLIRANRGPSPDDGGSVGVVLDDVACP